MIGPVVGLLSKFKRAANLSDLQRSSMKSYTESATYLVRNAGHTF